MGGLTGFWPGNLGGADEFFQKILGGQTIFRVHDKGGAKKFFTSVILGGHVLFSIKNSNIDDIKFIRQCFNDNIEYLRISNKCFNFR